MKVFLLKQARAWEEFYFTFLSFTFVRYLFSPLAQCLSTCVPPVVLWDNGLLMPWGMRQGGDRTLSISLASEHLLHSLQWIIPTPSFSMLTLMWKILRSSPLAQYQWLLRWWLAPNKVSHNQPIGCDILFIYTLHCINACQTRCNPMWNSWRKYDKGKIRVGKIRWSQERSWYTNRHCLEGNWLRTF